MNITLATSPVLASKTWKAPANASGAAVQLDLFMPSQADDWTPPQRPNFRAAAPSAPHSQPASETVTLPDGKSVAWGEFAANRHKPNTGCAYFTGSKEELLGLLQENWDRRQPGTGRDNLNEVVAVPVPADKFMTTVITVTDDTELAAGLNRRRSHEEPYIRVSAKGEAEPAKFAKVILYSAPTLASNNERTIDTDWEVVSLIASPVENEPMDPVTMMRNMRNKPGGTPVNYTADQLLDSIDFWSKHTKLSPK